MYFNGKREASHINFFSLKFQPMTALQSKPKVKHHSSEKKSSEKSEVKDKSIDKDKLKTPSDK